MLTEERHMTIMRLLKEKGVVKLQELVDKTETSESTIRRDLSQLEQEKKLKRVHGGAALLKRKAEEPSILEKSTRNLAEKQKIAKFAAALVQAGDCIYLDAGTTTYEMIPFLQEKNVIVVTNGLSHLEQLLTFGITTYLTGGLIKPNTRALIGKGAQEALNQYRFDQCFLGVNGIHREYGFTTPDPEEALIKKTALHLAQTAFVLADETKFSEVTFAKIADIHEISIMTNQIDQDTLEGFQDITTIKVVTE